MLFVVRLIVKPVGGAAPESLTVPVTALLPTTVAGDKDSELNVAGLTVSVAA